LIEFFRRAPPQCVYPLRKAGSRAFQSGGVLRQRRKRLIQAVLSQIGVRQGIETGAASMR
jgi:hypothetical protein